MVIPLLPCQTIPLLVAAVVGAGKVVQMAACPPSLNKKIKETCVGAAMLRDALQHFCGVD